MNPSDLGDATARALDLLPPGDPASSDPRLVRDPRLLDDARASRDAAAAVWLAVAPLRVAPPDILLEVMREIQSPESSRPVTRHRALPWLAASGWAAAALVAISLWPARWTEKSSSDVVVSQAASPVEILATAPPAGTQLSRNVRLRKEIVRLQDRLSAYQDDPLRRTSRVLSLSAPGAVRRSEDESREYLQKLLTDALRSALEASSGGRSDPASLVIERGWLPGGLPVPEDGGMIRHRNFPEQNWQALGLFKAAARSYYDASSQTVWSPDPEGRGFIGRRATEDDDIADFTNEPDQESAPLKPEATPEGFVIENPAEKSTEIFVENMPEIPPGKQLVLHTTDAAGVITTTSLTPTAAGESPVTDPLAMNMNDVRPTWSGRGTVLSSDGSISRSPVSSGTMSSAWDSSAAVSNVTSSANGAVYSSNIVGYLYGGSLIVSFSSDSIPAEVQLAIGDIVPTSASPTVILKSEP